MIRRAQACDAPTLARIHADAWLAAYHDLIPESFWENFSYSSRLARFQQILAEGTGETHVIQMGEDSAGFIAIGPSRDPDLDSRQTAEIWSIYLLPAYWRRGIGRKAFEEAERIFIEQGYRQVVVWALADNRRARLFYEAMGYTLDGQSKILELGKPLEAVRYGKELVESETRRAG